MASETKTCQNCKNRFTIETEDFNFYEKIQVPPPTFCPECRMIRRMIWRNERALYRRRCDVTNESIVSIYSQDKPLKVYKTTYWRSDNWTPFDYGMDYDFSHPFFEQFKRLLIQVPRQSLDQRNVIDSEFTHFVTNVKNSYMIFSCHDVENLYNTSANNAFDKDCADIMRTRHSERCYETTHSLRCQNLAFGDFCEECSDSRLLYDCRNCSHCFGCVGLRNKSYCIFNQQFTKEEYKQAIKSLNLGSFERFEVQRKKFNAFRDSFPRKFARIFKSVDCSGDDITNSKNCRFCFFAQSAENCKFGLTLIDGAKDIYDVTGSGINAELNYESVSAIGQRLYFSSKPWYDNDLYYCDDCNDSYNLFGCIGLRNKQYCILNKQYTKEEYKELVPKIIKHMNDMPYIDKKGRVYKYGEFFPPELSPFAYNETIAQEYFPLIKDEAIAQGYTWKNPEKKEYEITKKPEDLPNNIKDVKDNILQEVIGCVHEGKCNEQCTTAFKIIPQELQFYRKMNLPLPRLCPNCRHYQRLKQRNPLRLWHRKCQCAGTKSENQVYQNTVKHFHETGRCPNEFETSYSPDRKEIVYCEQCYNAEVV